MKIAFNLLGTGLGNNGGSRTLIKCAETLQELGEEVFLVSASDHYSWEPIKVPVIRKIPAADVVVATGIGSVGGTINCKVPKKFYYIRGYESWRASKEQLFRSYRSLNCIVNSKWLKAHLVSAGVESELIYPGIDADFSVLEEERRNILGGIFSKRHATKRHEDVLKVGKRLGLKVLLLNRDIINPSPKKLCAFYNHIKVWMSPSELEGLHNCPLEASLSGCGLVATNHPRGGTCDYAVDGETCLNYKARDLNGASEAVERLMNDEQLRKELLSSMVEKLQTIGTRKQNMLKMIRVFKNARPVN